MDFFENIKIPKIPEQSTHRIRSEGAFFIKSNDQAPKGIISFNSGTRVLPINTEVIVLEHAVGYRCFWSKIKFNDEIGFIETRRITPLNNTKPFCSVNEQFAANEFSIPINWKDKRPNQVYYNEYTGKVSVHYELPYEKVEGKEDLLIKLDEAYFLGTKRILQETGKVFTDDYVRTLLNQFYQFAQVEEYFFPLRPCSTLRVLVTIPKKYLESGSIEKSLLPVLVNPIFPNENLSVTVGDIVNTSGTVAVDQTANVSYTSIDYDSYKNFKDHMTKIGNRLKQVQVAYLAGINGWSIQPAVDVNLLGDIANLTKFFTLVNDLLKNNLRPSALTESTIDNPIAYLEKAKDEFLNFITLTDPDFIWNGKLKLIVDITNLQISFIEFINDLGEKEILNIGVFDFLDNPIIKNKTLINYLISIPIDLEFKTIEEIFQETLETATEFPNIDQLVNFVNNADERPEIAAKAELSVKENAQAISKAAQDTLKEGAKKTEKAIEDLKQFGQNFTPEKLVGEFLTVFHYPKIDSVRINPIDLANCIENNYDRITNIINSKIPSEIKKYDDFLKEAIRNQPTYEGGIFKKMQTDFTNDFSKVQDPNIRALFGLDPPPQPDPNDGPIQKALKFSNRGMAALNLVDWPRIIAEALKCSAVELDPAVLQSLLSVYKTARDFVETALLVSICNPYLSSILQKINNLNLPVLPVINRKQSLSDALIAQLLKIVNELLILLVRQLITGSIKACITNPKSNFGDNNINGINNSIDSGVGVNDPAINDLLNDLFNGITNPDGTIDTAKQDEAKEKLKDLVEDIINCLTPEELCKLLLGRSVNDEVYDVIISIVTRKYNTPNAGYNIADKLNNNESIRNLFKKVGANTGIDIGICEDLINRSPTDSFSLPTYCDPDVIRKLREALLKDKGLTDELVKDLLDDIKDKKEKEVENLLNALNSNNLEDLLNINSPNPRCSKGPNGETIPPTIDLSPPIDGFASMLNTFFDQYYDSFDQEATEWYKTTYSIKKSVENNTIVFDEQTGQLKPAENSIENFTKLFTPESSENTSNANNPPDELLPSFLFKDILDNNKFAITNLNEIYSIKSNINGLEQQKLDLTVISEELRNNIEIAEKSLKKFVTVFMTRLASYVGTVAVRSTTQFINLFDKDSNFFSQNQWLENIGRGFSFASRTELLQTLKKFDLFARNNLSDAQDLERASTILGLKSSDQAAAFLLSNDGAPVYLLLMDYITKNINQLNSYIETIYSIDPATEVLIWLNNGRQPSANRNNPTRINAEEKAILLGYLQKAITNFSLVKTYYQTVSNVKLTYPNFSLNYNLNSSELAINNNFVVKNSSNNKLYELYDVQINKNGIQYLKIRNGQLLSKEITDYITDTLNFGLESFNKETAYNNFINDRNKILSKTITVEEINDVLGSNPYTLANDSCIKNIQNKIISNENILLKINSQNTNAPEPENEEDKKGATLKKIDTPFTIFISTALKTPQTPDQKACGKRPHYLDINDIKNELLNNKRNAVCLDEVVEEKVKNGQPISSNELENLETTESQNIMLSGQYRLMIRVFLHDILLRGIAVFGAYDPQSLRKNEAFINFMADLVESEIRGLDNTVFNMMLNYLYKQYLFRNPNYRVSNTREASLKRDLYIDVVRKELKQNVLSKLSKRLLEDTNTYISNEPAIAERLRFVNLYNDFHNLNKYIRIESDGIYVKTFAEANSSVYTKIFQGTREQFRASPEFKLLFEYFVPLSHHLNFFFITNVLSTSTRRQIVNSFRTTKLSFFRTIKVTQAHGLPVIPDPNNPQDLLNADSETFWQDFIRERLVKTPLEIFKGFMETGDPNIALSATTYKLIKSFVPNQSSLMIPAMSIPLGIPLLPLGFTLGIVPYSSFITAAVYFASLVWYDDDKKATDNSKNTFYDRLLSNISKDIDCSVVPDKEKINLTPEGYYLWDSTSPQTLTDVQRDAARERASTKNNPSGEI